MTAPLVNRDTSPMDVESWQAIGDHTRSMSWLVTSARTTAHGSRADYAAETRVWGSGHRVTRAEMQPLARDERYPTTVGYEGKNAFQHPRWDRIIWTNVEPYHNSGRVFRGREELED